MSFLSLARALSPCVWQWAMAIVDENGTSWGRFSFNLSDPNLASTHPADAVLTFSRAGGLPATLRRTVAAAACNSPKLAERCGGRNAAIVGSIPVQDHTGAFLGSLTIFDGQEAADAVYIFVRQRGLPPDFQKTLLNAACNDPNLRDVICSRQRAIKYEESAAELLVRMGRVVGEDLIVWEDEEVADAAKNLANRRGLGDEFYRKGANVQLGPGLCLARVPRNGRNFEYLSGEDPLLGSASIRPCRAPPSNDPHALVCPHSEVKNGVSVTLHSVVCS